MRISVLMGIYNCASTLPEALNSLFSQTYKEFKIILCDDGSNDNTYQVAKGFASSHDNIVLIQNDRNRGLNYTLNHCLEYADTEYIARMDGDDFSLPTRFQTEIDFLDTHPEYAVVSVPMIYFDEMGEFRRGTGNGEIDKMDFIHGSPICHAPCMARTAIIKSVGGYSVDDKLLRVEDYDLWIKIYSAGYNLYMLNTPLYKMRDDRNAVARRNWKTRRNEFLLRWGMVKRLGLPWYCLLYSFRPIIIHCLPRCVYQMLHKKSSIIQDK